MFAPEDLASQITLIDHPVFCNIMPDELTSCSWTKKNKETVAPNVVAFIRRFNYISFWTVQEVLRYGSVKLRADAMSHFIRVAKRLHELNNLNAEYAIVSALQSAPIYRLDHTWASLSRKDKGTFEKLAELFSEAENFSRLRNHMNGIAMKHVACAPYLGLYLTDLVYVDMAHPHSGGMESRQRQIKMNNILRVVSELQHYKYTSLPVVENCRNYLRSIRYIDELQKFIEDDNYRLSLKLEPNSQSAPGPSSSSSKESVHSSRDPKPNLMAELNLSPAKANSSTGAVSKKPFVPGHRKCRSDGASIFLSCSGGGGVASASEDSLQPWSNSGTLSNAGSEERFRHLLDDSLLEDPYQTMPASTSSSTCCAPEDAGCFGEQSEKARLTDPKGMFLTPEELSVDPGTKCTFQGCIKRKTLIKDGRRPTISAWQRYWLQLWGSSLVFFSARSLTKGTDRRDFHSEPAKYQSIVGCLVMVSDSGSTLDNLSFQLTDPVRRNVYRFRTPSPDLAKGWVQYLSYAVRGLNVQSLPDDLIDLRT